MKRKVHNLLTVATLISSSIGFSTAQTGTLDLSFNSTGSTSPVNTSSNMEMGLTKVVEFPSNGLTAPGNLYQLSTILEGGFYKLRVSSYLPSGAVNTSFNGGLGYRVYDIMPGTSIIGKDITLRNDSRIVVGFQVNNGTGDAGIMVIEPTGNLVTTFNSTGYLIIDIAGNGSTDELGAIATTANGSTFVGGATAPASNPTAYDTYLLRVDINGVLQTTEVMDILGGNDSYETVKSIDVKHDPANPFMSIENKATAALYVTDIMNGISAHSIYRFGINCTGDNTFGTNPSTAPGFYSFGSGVTAIVDIAHDDVNGGWFALCQDNGTGMLLKLTEAGIADNTFGTMSNGFFVFGFLAQFSPTGLEIRLNGKINVVGRSTNNIGVARVNANGTYDNTFSTDGQNIITTGLTYFNTSNCVVLGNNKIILAANYSATNYYNLLFRINGSPSAGDCNGDGSYTGTEIAGDVNCSGAIERPTEICGDIDGDGTITSPEIAGDKNGNGTIDYPTEVCGDLNGDGDAEDADEIAGDQDGDGGIDFPSEICGDLNGDGDTQDTDEIAGDQNGDGTINRPTEVAGDLNGNGTIDVPTEIAGDVDGDGGINFPTEICGDLNGNGVINTPDEVGGDASGNGAIETPEVLGDTNGNGILDASEQLGVSELNTIQLAVYPNPASAQLTITANQNIESISILDLTGRLIQTTAISTQETVTIDVHSLEKGRYMIVVTNATGASSMPFVKL